MLWVARTQPRSGAWSARSAHSPAIRAWVPACGRGIKALAAGYREVADDNANPHADFWGEKPR